MTKVVTKKDVVLLLHHKNETKVLIAKESKCRQDMK